MPHDTLDLSALILDAANHLGVRSGPSVADHIIGTAFPKTLASAKEEGAEHILRNGLIAHVARVLRGTGGGVGQSDLAEVEASFGAYIKPLKSGSYFVPSREEYVSVADLIATPSEMKEAETALRRHGLDCIAEADRLARLHDAVTGNEPIGANDPTPHSEAA